MNKIFFLLLSVLSISFSARSAVADSLPTLDFPDENPEPAKSNMVSVMTFNVRHLEGLDGRIDEERVAKTMAMGFDIVMIQEIDSVTGRSMGHNQLDSLASYTYMHPIFAKAIPFEGGSYGIGMLAKKHPLSVKRIPLPGSEPRVLLIAEFPDFVAACTHLALEEDARLQSAEIIATEAARYNKPFIIAGDWNDTPDSPLLQRMRKDFVINTPQSFTFPSGNPSVCLDYIATFKKFPGRTILSCIADVEGISDHDAAVAVLRF